MKRTMFRLASVLASFALVVTFLNVNSTCYFWMNQPELPEGAQKLRIK